MATDIENQKTEKQLSDEEIKQLEQCAQCAHLTTHFLILALFVSVILSLVYDTKITEYSNEKVHGVHSTNFTFTGNYTIVTTCSNCDNLVYNVNCISYTHHYGNCEYLYYSTYNYYNIDSHLETFCIEGVTINGYISTETKECTNNYPNHSTHKLYFILKICLIIAIVSCLLLINIFMCISYQHHCIIKNNKKYNKINLENDNI